VKIKKIAIQLQNNQTILIDSAETTNVSLSRTVRNGNSQWVLEINAKLDGTIPVAILDFLGTAE
jgi:hypothetical protein